MTSKLFRGSKHALLYSKFRPSPPVEFIDYIIKNVKSEFGNTLEQAVDIGCGSGQSTIVLAPYFRKVIGCDISKSQIDCAKTERSANNVEYRVCDCEKLSLPNSSIQLVTSSQAIHWFDTSKIFDEIKRLLIPNGVIAIYGYWIPFPETGISEKNKELKCLIDELVTSSQAIHWFDTSKIFDEIKRLLIPNGVIAIYGYWIPFPETGISEKNKELKCLIDEELHENLLGKYWNKERYIVKNYYRNLDFPFKNIQRMDITKTSKSTLADYIGYLSTWSAYQKLCIEDSEKGEQILKNTEEEILKILDTNKAPEEVIFLLHTDFFMLMGNA